MQNGDAFSICRAVRLANPKRITISVNLQSNFPPLLATAAKEALMAGATQEEEDGYDAGANKDSKGEEKHHPLLMRLLAEELGCEPAEIADFELQLCEWAKP